MSRVSCLSSLCLYPNWSQLQHNLIHFRKLSLGLFVQSNSVSQNIVKSGMHYQLTSKPMSTASQTQEEKWMKNEAVEFVHSGCCSVETEPQRFLQEIQTVKNIISCLIFSAIWLQYRIWTSLFSYYLQTLSGQHVDIQELRSSELSNNSEMPSPESIINHVLHLNVK